MSRESYYDWIGADWRTKKRITGYMTGLVTHGCVHLLTYHNRPLETGQSMAISPYGARVLEAFYELIEIEEKNKPGSTPIYDIITDSSQPPKGYRLRQAGRND